MSTARTTAIRWRDAAMALLLSIGTSLGITLVMMPEPNDQPPSLQQAVAPEPQAHRERPAAPQAVVAPPKAAPKPARPTDRRIARTQVAKAAPRPPPVVYRKYIRVDMGRREVALYQDGELIKLITGAGFGRTGHETPRLVNASLSIRRRERMHYSRRYDDAPMPYALFLNESPGVAFHAGNVGGRSHGCIHLRTQDAKWLFNWVGRDPVKVDIKAGARDRADVAFERGKLLAAAPVSRSRSSEPPESPSAGERDYGDAEASLASAPPKLPASEEAPEADPQ